jgi:hypothetical protein
MTTEKGSCASWPRRSPEGDAAALEYHRASGWGHSSHPVAQGVHGGSKALYVLLEDHEPPLPLANAQRSRGPVSRDESRKLSRPALKEAGPSLVHHSASPLLQVPEEILDRVR